MDGKPKSNKPKKPAVPKKRGRRSKKEIAEAEAAAALLAATQTPANANHESHPDIDMETSSTCHSSIGHLSPTFSFVPCFVESSIGTASTNTNRNENISIGSKSTITEITETKVKKARKKTQEVDTEMSDAIKLSKPVTTVVAEKSITKKTEKRVMTSAIPGMTVAEVRKALGEVRKKAEMCNEKKPLYLTDVLSNGMKISSFCLEFVNGHHNKRHSKASVGVAVNKDE